MRPDPHQQFQKQMMEQQRQQMQHMREQQMKGAWYMQQQAKAGGAVYPVKQRSGCVTAIIAVFSFAVSLVVFAVFCGGAGYLAGGILVDDDTAILGAAAGGLLALVLAFVTTRSAVRSQ